MDHRKLRILRYIIDDYILTGIPVGSRTIAKKYETNLSSATIRNEMSDLEEMGLLEQPHVSAGRIPSAKAYRLYVDYLLETEQIPAADSKYLQKYFTNRIGHVEDVIEHTAKALSSLTNYTAVVISPKGKSLTIRNVQLVPININTALMIIVTNEGMIKDAVLRIPDSIEPDTLYAISCTLSKQLHGHQLSEAQEILSNIKTELTYQRQMLTTLIDVTQSIEEQAAHVSVGGGSKILSYPEYADTSKAQSFLSLLETKETLVQLLSNHGEMAFTVRIGAETGLENMDDLSVVSAAFSFGKGSQGSIGVIGPTRMHYGKVLAILGTMGDQLTQLFNTKDTD
ncbi:MAG: heat-inducible transcription repressor HrcA [Clostridiales bacterium]|nr:heat-inducible transcription repressor HrcA [Clostridiales bacterium]